MKRALTAALSLLAFCAAAQSQPYPTRSIILIVPFPAGGPSDTLARVLVEPMRVQLGQSVIIENVGGAGGSIGTGRVARAAPDGYTLIFGHVQTHVINGATQTLNYDVVKDFEPVSLVADTPQWIAARSSFAPNTMAEWIAWLKANPGKGTVGSVGVGGPTDVAAVTFQKQTGTSFQLVPYRGGAPLLQDLLGGQIEVTFGQAANYLNAIRGGQLKAYAVLSSQRWWAAPNVPTMDEAGVPGLYSSFWHGVWAPKGTPKEIVTKLNQALVASLADDKVKVRLTELAVDLPSAEEATPEALRAQLKASIDKWVPAVQAAGVKPE